MELLYIGIGMAIGIILSLISGLSNSNPTTLPKAPEEPKPNYKEHNDALIKKTQEELDRRIKDSTDRYCVEVTTKKGEVHKTEPFEPSGHIDSYYNRHYGELNYQQLNNIQVYFWTSREKAEQFVNNHQYSYNNSSKLVQFGDEYICKDSIDKVRLVKV